MNKEWATKISRVIEGKVLIRGYSHEELIGDRTFAEGVFLTLRGELPTKNEARMTDALLNSLLDHGFVAASVLAARYTASGNPQIIPATAAGLLTAGSNTISPQHGAQFMEDAYKLMQSEKLSQQETARRVIEQVRSKKHGFLGTDIRHTRERTFGQ